MIFGRRLYLEAQKGYLDLARDMLRKDLGFSHERRAGASKHASKSMGWSYDGAERSEALFFSGIMEGGTLRDVVELRYLLKRGAADRGVFERDHLATAACHLRGKIPGEIIEEDIGQDIEIGDMLSRLRR